MLRSFLFQSPPLFDLTQDQQVLFPDTQKHVTLQPKRKQTIVIRMHIGYLLFITFFIVIQNNRETYHTKEKQATSPFIYIQQELYELRCNLEQLTGYEQDRIKFMTKVEVDQSKREGVCSRIEIVQEPIFSKSDVITFLLIFKWYTNANKTNSKTRKGSFVTQKEASFYRSHLKNRMQQKQLIYIVFLLSQKIYIEDRFLDQFINVISTGGQVHYKQLNCLTIILLGGQGRHRVGNMASTEVESNKYEHYSFENLCIYNSIAQAQKENNNPDNQNHLNKYRYLLLRNCSYSRYLDKSSKLYLASQQNFKDNIRFNLQKTKRYFSAIQYFTSPNEINIQMIIMQLGQDKNFLEGGFHFSAVSEILSQWPKYNNYGRIYNLNKLKILEDVLKQSIQNYKLLVQIQLFEIQNPSPDQIYNMIDDFTANIQEEFLVSTKEYFNQSDYDGYLKRLEKEMEKLEKQVFKIFTVIKQEYGTRLIQQLQRRSLKALAQNYLFMKIFGREELNNLNIGYPMYKKLIESKLQQGFAQFLSKKFKGRDCGQDFGNYSQDYLNNIENRIQILQAKKKNLFSAIQLGLKDQQQLRVMLKILKCVDRGDSLKSQLHI